MSENRYEWELTYLTIICGIGPVVPIDKTLPKNEIINILNSSNIHTIFCSKNYYDVLLEIKNQTSLDTIICFDDSYFSKLIEDGNKLLDAGNRKYLDIKINDDDIAVLFYTSGTTSKSKVVALSNRNIYSNIMALQNTLDMSCTDKFLSILPLHHVFECTFGFLFPISIGAQIVFSKGIRHLLDEIKDNNITVMANVPVVYEMLLKIIEKNLDRGKTVSDILGNNLRFLISGAAYLNPEIESRYRTLGLNLMQAYGLSETSPIISISTNENYSLGSVGKPLSNLKIKVVDKDENGIGELLVKGDSIMLGYLKNKKLSKDSFKYRWFYTGDLVFVDDNGFIYIKGRKKNVIVLENGKNIYPEEIESIVNNVIGIKESIVFDKNNKLNVKVVIDKNKIIDNYNIKENDIYKTLLNQIKLINKTIPLYKNIKDIVITEEPFIKTATNKIKRIENLKDVL